ncbi:NAD-dependent epimerase/dehydratase family protein, partial [Pseudomonas donghuensis]|nr:NAD-dependent epimerase/dehydratase family protein [Pseudomonas donghuensis]
MVVSEKSKILIIGGTGYIGKYLVETSAKSGHPTFALIRESTLKNPEKSKLIDTFKSYGVTLLFVCTRKLLFFHTIFFVSEW